MSDAKSPEETKAMIAEQFGPYVEWMRANGVQSLDIQEIKITLAPVPSMRIDDKGISFGAPR